MSSTPGKLFIVATPIGNLEDITLRALRTLREATVVAAEDTRHTGSLLAHFELRKPLVSYHEFNEAQRCPELLRRIHAGERVVVVSDAGMPLLSDPGLRLVRAALAANLPVEVVPGPSAVTMALAASGLATAPCLFYGFLPHKATQRRKAISGLASLPFTLVFFESPYRLARCLADLRDILGNRQAVVAREMTKKFEEFMRGDLETLAGKLEARSVKGEVTLVVEGQHT
jgi:16S rRNA (cytidine1402-2'-O)-methyltransferase